MRQAVSDWKARQAGEREEEQRAPAADPRVLTTHYVGRRTWCSGGEYIASKDATGKPVARKARCFREANWITGLCEDCERREQELRAQLREWATPKGAVAVRKERFER